MLFLDFIMVCRHLSKSRKCPQCTKTKIAIYPMSIAINGYVLCYIVDI